MTEDLDDFVKECRALPKTFPTLKKGNLVIRPDRYQTIFFTITSDGKFLDGQSRECTTRDEMWDAIKLWLESQRVKILDSRGEEGTDE